MKNRPNNPMQPEILANAARAPAPVRRAGRRRWAAARDAGCTAARAAARPAPNRNAWKHGARSAEVVAIARYLRESSWRPLR